MSRVEEKTHRRPATEPEPEGGWHGGRDAAGGAARRSPRRVEQEGRRGKQEGGAVSRRDGTVPRHGEQEGRPATEPEPEGGRRGAPAR
jgi:hypothetical protein